MNTTLASITISAGLLCAAHASAQITYTDQWRDIEAGSGNGATYEYIWATDFGPFSASVNMYSENPDGSFASGRAMSQDSRLDPDRISFTGAVRGGAGETTAGFTWPAYGRSQVNASFTLAAPSAFEASILTTASGTTTIDIFLARVGGPNIFTGPGVFSGQLEAGDYSFRAFIRADGIRTFDPDSGAEVWFGSRASINALLVIPSPGAMGLASAGLLALSARRHRAWIGGWSR